MRPFPCRPPARPRRGARRRRARPGEGPVELDCTRLHLAGDERVGRHSVEDRRLPVEVGREVAGALAAADELCAALEREAGLRSLWDDYATLSRREQEVMALVVAGLLNKQIAAELRISETTSERDRCARRATRRAAFKVSRFSVRLTRVGLRKDLGRAIEY